MVEKAEPKSRFIETKDEVEVLDFAETIARGIGRVMRDRKAMQGVEKEFDVTVFREVNNLKPGGTTMELRDKLRKQLQDGRSALESLESRLLSIITG